ncbi:MAG: hypothetical protein ABJE10_07735 [bacterium]
MTLLLRFTLTVLLCAAPCVYGQLPVPTPPTATIPGSSPPIVTESLSVFERPNGVLMRPAALTYLMSLTKSSGQTIPLGTRTVTVSDAALGGAAGWLIAEARRGTAVESTDSVYLARADLAPERWSATIGRAQLGASFTRDSAFGAVESYQGRSSFAMAVPPGALLSAGMVERLVELLPLRVGYRASAWLMLVDGTSPRALPAEIAVDREDRATVSGRTVDCWLVSIRAGMIEQRLWVSKSESRVVRVEQALPDGVLSSVLQ